MYHSHLASDVASLCLYSPFVAGGTVGPVNIFSHPAGRYKYRLPDTSWQNIPITRRKRGLPTSSGNRQCKAFIQQSKITVSE